MSFDSSWELVHAQHEWLSVPEGTFLEFYDLYYKNTSNLLFVDLGCGTGAQTLFLATKGQKVLGIDASSTAVSKLLRNLNALKIPPGQITPMWGDVMNLNFEDNTIDCVVEVALFEQIPFNEAFKVAQRALKYLKPGGRFFSRICMQIITGKEYIRSAYHRETSLEEVKQMFEGFAYNIIGGHIADKQIVFNFWYVDAQKVDPCQESTLLLSPRLESITAEKLKTPSS